LRELQKPVSQFFGLLADLCDRIVCDELGAEVSQRISNGLTFANLAILMDAARNDSQSESVVCECGIDNQRGWVFGA
jgi:hypothetical protein